MEAPLMRGRWEGTAQQFADAIKSIVIPKGSDFLRYDAIDKVYQARTDVKAIRENHGLLQALYGLRPAFCFSKKTSIRPAVELLLTQNVGRSGWDIP